MLHRPIGLRMGRLRLLLRGSVRGLLVCPLLLHAGRLHLRGAVGLRLRSLLRPRLFPGVSLRLGLLHGLLKGRPLRLGVLVLRDGLRRLLPVFVHSIIKRILVHDCRSFASS